MTFEIVTVEQRSEAWFAARLGRVTGSTANAVLSKGRSAGTESVQRVNLRTRLALERITGRSLENDFQTPAMTQGIEREAEALAAYEAATGQLIETTGFLKHVELMAGCSLDAHVGDFEGLVSIKCPIPATHLETLRKRDAALRNGTQMADTIPADYSRQILHEQWVTGAAWTDYVSFNPDFPGALRLCVIRVERDAKLLDAYELALRLFLTEVEREQAEIQKMTEVAA